MISFGDAERAASLRLIGLGFEEDLGTVGDLTCAAVIAPDLEGQASFVARVEGVLAGLPVAELIYQREKSTGAALTFAPLLADGARLSRGAVLAHVRGGMRSILSAERVVLNFLQRLSGVASLTQRYVDVVADLPVQILDT